MDDLTPYQEMAARVLRSQPPQLREWRERQKAARKAPPPEPGGKIVEVVAGSHLDRSYETTSGDQVWPPPRGRATRKPRTWCSVCQRRMSAREEKQGHVHDKRDLKGKLVTSTKPPRSQKRTVNSGRKKPRRAGWKYEGHAGGVSQLMPDPRIRKDEP